MYRKSASLTDEATEEIQFDTGDGEEGKENAVAVHELEKLKAPRSGVEQTGGERGEANNDSNDVFRDQLTSELRLEIVDEVHQCLDRSQFGVDSDEKQGYEEKSDPGSGERQVCHGGGDGHEDQVGSFEGEVGDGDAGEVRVVPEVAENNHCPDYAGQEVDGRDANELT